MKGVTTAAANVSRDGFTFKTNSQPKIPPKVHLSRHIYYVPGTELFLVFYLNNE